MMDSAEYRINNSLTSPLRQTEIPRPRLCFVHIEKTAGTSLHDYFLEIAPLSEVFPERLQDLDRYPPEEDPRYRLYSGHYDLVNCGRMPPDTRYITFLRRPEDRVLSVYYFWRSVLSDGDGPHVQIAKTSGLAEFLRNPLTWFAVHDTQVARLLPEGTGGPEAAIAALDSFALVGIRELYSLSVLMLAHKFGWPLPSRLARRLGPDEIRSHPNHRRVEREPVTPEIADLLRERTRGDAVVYEYALRRFATEFREIFGMECPAEQLPVAAGPL
jgi:hypothetical protein